MAYGQYNPSLIRPNIGTRTPFRTALDEKPNPWDNLSMQRDRQMEIPEPPEQEDNSFLSNLKALQSRGAGPANSQYSQFLSQGAPRREDYERSKGAKIAAALITGLGAYSGNREAGRMAQEGLDRPYNEAVEQYKMTGSNLNEQAEREDSHYKSALDAEEAIANLTLKNKYELRQEARQDNQFKLGLEAEAGRNNRLITSNEAIAARQREHDATMTARAAEAERARAAEGDKNRAADLAKYTAMIKAANWRDSNNPGTNREPSYTEYSKAKTDARNQLLNSPDWIWLKDNLDPAALTEGNLVPFKGKSGMFSSGGDGKEAERAAHLVRFEEAVEDKAKELLGGKPKAKTSAAPAAEPEYVKDPKTGKWVLRK